MSFTALRAIERCPLQWALTHAEYANVWEGAGYPERPHTATVTGRIVHGAIEAITRALTNAGISSPSEQGATQILKTLGGITAVLQAEVEKVTADLQNNPRLRDWRELRAELMRNLPAMRQRVQFMLSRVSTAVRLHEITGENCTLGMPIRPPSR